MIAAHDSYTYLKGIYKIYNTFTGPWKCQDKSIQELYDSGVRYFDIRLKREVKAKKNMWRPCHGLVDLNFLFTSIKNVCAYFESLEGVYYRILLEKGNEEDEKAFTKEIEGLEKTYPHLNWVVIKDGWKTLLPPSKFHIVDYCCPTNTFQKLVDFSKYSFSIKKWAKENNPTITPEMIADENTVYFYDFI